MTSDLSAEGRATHQKIGLFLGPAVALFMLLVGSPDDLSDAGWATAACGVLMAIWWATEAVPIAVTALLPLVAFPLLGVTTIQATASPYANKVIFLFLGGFIVAYTMQRWNLHRRIALNVLQLFGSNGKSLVAGFMLASALLSMWVMNTSTTMMLLPIAVSIISVIHSSVPSLDDKAQLDFQYALLLGVAYGATIGGMATLVGTLPNAALAGFMLETYDTEIAFSRWMMIGVPLAMVMLPLAWLALTRWAFTVNFETSGEGKSALKKMHSELGRMTVPEARVAIVFAILVVAWVGRPVFSLLPGLSALDDSSIAMAGAIALFIIPSGDKSDPMLIRWHYVEQLPWNVLLLFGGGLTLASAVSKSGLAEWIGGSLQGLTALPLVGLVFIAATMIILLTEFTSNTATTLTFLPIVGAVAVAAGIDPIVLAVPITLAASCAFMLPVATPPNAIVFGSGMLTIPTMMRAGFVLNIVGVIIVSLAAIFLAPLVFP